MNLDPPMSQDSLLDTLRDSDQPGLAAREFLEAGQARLDEAFHEAPITELVHGRARLVDRVLIAAWSLFGLDRFAEAVLAIREIIRECPAALAEAPHFTPIDRVDEVDANRNLVLCEKLDSLPPIPANRVPPDELLDLPIPEIKRRITALHA